MGHDAGFAIDARSDLGDLLCVVSKAEAKACAQHALRLLVRFDLKRDAKEVPDVPQCLNRVRRQRTDTNLGYVLLRQRVMEEGHGESGLSQ